VVEFKNAMCVIALKMTVSFSLALNSSGRIIISNHNTAADYMRAIISCGGASARAPL
jgi:hypothetical protein